MAKDEGATVKVAEAAGTASAGGGAGLGARIQSAMDQAVADCFADGVTGDEEVRDAKLAAREKAKEEFAAEEAARLEAEAAATE